MRTCIHAIVIILRFCSPYPLQRSRRQLSLGRVVSEYILTNTNIPTIVTTNTEPTEVNVENCGWRASTRKN